MYFAAMPFQRFTYDYVAHFPSDLDAVLSMGGDKSRRCEVQLTLQGGASGLMPLS